MDGKGWGVKVIRSCSWRRQFLSPNFCFQKKGKRRNVGESNRQPAPGGRSALAPKGDISLLHPQGTTACLWSLGISHSGGLWSQLIFPFFEHVAYNP